MTVSFDAFQLNTIDADGSDFIVFFCRLSSADPGRIRYVCAALLPDKI